MFTTGKTALLLLFIAILTLSCKDISQLLNPKSGTEFIVQVETGEPDTSGIFQQAIEKLKKNMDAAGVSGEINTVSGEPLQLDVKVYEPKDIERTKKLLFTNYRLELKKVISPPSPSPMQGYPSEEEAKAKLSDNQEILPFADKIAGSKRFVIVESAPIITGRDIRDALAKNVTGMAESYSISFNLSSDGATKFGDWTGKNINNYLAIVLNREIVSAAFIKTRIADSGIIDGRFSKQEAEDVASSLKTGYLPAAFKILRESQFGK